MEWRSVSPKRGDIVRTKVSFYCHYGIFVSEDEVIQFGLPDDPGRPANEIHVLTSDIYTFLAGGDVEVAHPSREEAKKMRSREEIIRCARERIGESGYDILHNNCEHFVNSCAFGENSSSFLDEVREKIRKKLGRK